MITPRNWLCLITSTREYDNIAELTEGVWEHFDGICAVVHRQGGDDRVVNLLNERKKAGFVKETDWTWHHGHSMNMWLFDPTIRMMDTCWIRDSSERLNPQFTQNIHGLSADLLNKGIWNLAQHSKLLMFRRWFNQQFVNGLHWGLMGLYGKTIAIDLVSGFQNDRDYAYSVRGEKRPADHRYEHEVRYLIEYGANGNHLQLFFQDPAELDRAQWRLFEFLCYLDDAGVKTTAELREHLKSLPELSGDLKKWLNANRPLRNFYRYYVLGHTNEAILRDENDWRIG